MKRFSCLTAFSGLFLMLGGAGSENSSLPQTVFCMLGGFLLLVLAERLYTVRTSRLVRRLRNRRRTFLHRMSRALRRLLSAFVRRSSDGACVRLPKKADC